MNSKKILFSGLFITIMLSFFHLRAEEQLAPQIERYSERVLVVKTGIVYFDQVAAIATSKGIIMIDTGIAPTLTKKYREIIEREFRRNDFLYVINTHYHFDHTCGNQIFADAIIIAHETTPDRMREFKDGLPDFIQQRKAQNNQLVEQLKILDPTSDNAIRFQNLLHNGRIMVNDLEHNYIMTLPTLTFEDRMTIYSGDLSLKLFHFGEGQHTGDDILIYCPEEQLLFSGDLFFKGSFRIASRPQFDVLRWIEVLNEIFNGENEIKYVYDTHNGRMTGEFISLWRDYLVDLRNKFSTIKNEDLDLTAIQEKYAYDNGFTYIEKSGIDPDQLRRDHETNVRFMWYNINDMQSASQTIFNLINDSGIKAATDKFQQIRSDKNAKFFYDENEFNQIGYRLLQQNRINEAIEIFKMNVEMYPNSGNVYDSLGEGYMNNGQTDLAIKNYKKSIELNPQNNNGIEILKRLESEN